MSEGSELASNASNRLGDQEATALDALRDGRSFPEAAKQAGIGRATLYRWVQSNPHFKAAYNAWQHELAESGRARLLKLSEKAIAVLEQALDRGDEKIALHMLRHTGVLRKQKAGSTDAEVVELQMQLKHRREHQKATHAMLHHLLRKTGMPARQRRQIINGRASGDFMKKPEALSAKGPPAKVEKTGETIGSKPDPQGEPNSSGQSHSDVHKPLPQQEIDAAPPLAEDALCGETPSETNPGVSHDLNEDEKSQVVAGWRVGMPLNGVP